jgi:hypothetical protein
MLHFPDIMRKAQAEFLSVVGYDRMPEFEDKENLPYLLATINKTLRYTLLLLPKELAKSCLQVVACFCVGGFPSCSYCG